MTRRAALASLVVAAGSLGGHASRGAQVDRTTSAMFVAAYGALLARANEPVPPPPVVTLVDVNSPEKESIALLDDAGHVRSDARTALRQFFRCRTTGRSRPVPAELIQLLARIAEHFGSRIEFVSGFRPPGRGSSEGYHGRGMALDFAVRGQTPRAVYKYARFIGARGAGYYPRGGFVHIDTRETKYFWIDRSGHGEPSRERRDL